MKITSTFATVLVSALMAYSAFGATKTYQVTGPVLDVSDSSVTVEKGKEKWEISRDASTSVQGEIKKGDKVTIQYRMSAASIEVKGAKPEKADKTDKTEKADPKKKK